LNRVLEKFANSVLQGTKLLSSCCGVLKNFQAIGKANLKKIFQEEVRKMPNQVIQPTPKGAADSRR